MEKQKSLGKNFVYSLLKTMMGVVFPLITFPYATRVLGAASLGKIDYAQANITYFSLLGAFGVSGYAVREGARIRDDRERLSRFSGEVLAVNVVTVLLAYIACFLTIMIDKFAPYRGLMCLFSLTILLTSMGMEWLYNIHEEYAYITVRSFVFQLISVVLLYVFVKSPEDYLIYAGVLITSSVGSNIMNFVRAHRYIRVRPIFNANFWKHLKPMSLIFVMNLATSVYLVMDRSMLGFITENDREVGLYGAAIKITVVITSMVGAVNVVMIPRVSYTLKRDEAEGRRLNDFTVRAVALLGVPCVVGIFFLAKPVLVLFAGKEYGAAGFTLQLLMLEVLIALENGVLINQVFIAFRKDSWATLAVIIGAVTNLIANAILIPMYGKDGAAIGTIAAETAIFLFAIVRGRSLYRIEKVVPQLAQSVIACLPMVAIYFALHTAGAGMLVTVLATVVGGGALYLAALMFLKNDIMVMAWNKVINRLIQKKEE